MTDRYATFANSGLGHFLVRRLGLPNPHERSQRRVGDPVAPGRVLIGGTQLLDVAPGGEDALESTLRFLLSNRSANLAGQPIYVGPATIETPDDWERPLVGKVAVVTGATEGIGSAVVRALAQDGAHVICLDLPAAADALANLADDVSGTALLLDVTADDAPRRISEFIATRHVHADIFVHHTDVSIASQERINNVLIGECLLGGNGRLIIVDSVGALAGNRGPADNAASRADWMGLVEALAPTVAEHGITVNAVASAVLKTPRIASTPVLMRAARRRLTSRGQAALPVDIAETVAWLANPASGGVTGNVVRVCAQRALGA